MGWEYRRGQKYYYRSRRINGRVVKQYVGTGEAAEVAAKLDAQALEQKELIRAQRFATEAEIAARVAALEPLHKLVDDLVYAAMFVAGYRKRRGQWRRIVVNPETATQPGVVMLPIQDMLQRARKGDTSTLESLRHLFSNPDTVEKLGGNVATSSLAILIKAIAGTDLVKSEAIQAKLALLRQELLGAEPMPLERLMVDRVVATWFQLHQLEREYALADPTILQAMSYQKSITAAQSRYFAAILTLTKVRRLALPALQVNIAREQVNVVGTPLSALPTS